MDCRLVVKWTKFFEPYHLQSNGYILLYCARCNYANGAVQKYEFVHVPKSSRKFRARKK